MAEKEAIVFRGPGEKTGEFHRGSRIVQFTRDEVVEEEPEFVAELLASNPDKLTVDQAQARGGVYVFERPAAASRQSRSTSREGVSG